MLSPLCECVNYRYSCVCMCVFVLILSQKDCCNNRQQSCKVTGSLVNTVQTTGHNPLVTHSK